MSDNVFFHSGDLGDIIAALPAIRALGGGHLVIGDGFCRESMAGARFQCIKPLLEAQSYIKSVAWGKSRGCTHDFSTFRRNFVFGRNLAIWQASHLKAEITFQPWLRAKPDPRSIGRAVFARSGRYHNHAFPWSKYLRENPDAWFVGTTTEHAAFEKEMRVRIQYLPTRDLLELAGVIAGGKLFVGNQSCPFWIAGGLGVNLVQETSHAAPDSIIRRPNAQYPTAPEFIMNPTTPDPSKPLNVIIPFHKGDIDRVVRLVSWIKELGPQPGKFWLMCVTELQDPALLPPDWEYLTDYARIESGWNNNHQDASGPNSMWRQASKEMLRREAGPWLWLEPDAVPCRPDWLSVIARSFYDSGRAFLGAHRPSSSGARMSGVAVYAQETPRRVREPYICDPIAFDQAGAHEFLRQAMLTPLIVDKPVDISTKEDFEAHIPEGTAIFHHCKTGAILPFLRARLFGKTEFVRVPDRPDEITDMLNQRMAEQTVTTKGPHEAAALSSLAVAELSDSVNGLNGKRTDLANLSVSATITMHLDAIMAVVGEDKKRRAKLYEALQAHGIECGRNKRKQKTKK